MNELTKLWGEGELRAFISHKASYRRQAAEIKERLAYYGIASFVAHDDIEPMSEWESEITRALFSMHVLIALLTNDFSESNWTDQEVGVAIGRRVSIVPVKLGKDPYGFIGRYQAISATNRNNRETTDLIKEAILKDESIPNELRNTIEQFPQQKSIERIIADMQHSQNFYESNDLAGELEAIRKLSPEQEVEFVRAYNGNKQVFRAFEFQGRVISDLRRWTGNLYELRDERLLRIR